MGRLLCHGNDSEGTNACNGHEVLIPLRPDTFLLSFHLNPKRWGPKQKPMTQCQCWWHVLIPSSWGTDALG